jgi:NTP pyrophosphatase (non-canonical NTP hydrolase)
MKAMNFDEIYSDISRINKKDPATAAERLGKLFEEAGELAQALNKTNGRKVIKKEETSEIIELEILHEAADTIQNVIAIIDGFGWTCEHLMFAMQTKNKKWEEKVDGKNIQN